MARCGDTNSRARVATSYNATGLLPGTVYTFEIAALDVNLEENSVVFYSFPTVALGGQQTGTLPPGGTIAARAASRRCHYRTVADLRPRSCDLKDAPRGRVSIDWNETPGPGGHALGLVLLFRVRPAPPAEFGVSTGLAAGVAVAVILIIVLLVVGFFVYKRGTEKKQKKLLEEYSSQLQMVRRSGRGGAAQGVPRPAATPWLMVRTERAGGRRVCARRGYGGRAHACS